MILDDLPVRLVIATRHNREKFFAETAAGRSIGRFMETSPAVIRLFDNNSAGLSTVYNRAIDEAHESPAILAFMHDDVIVADYFWADNVRAGLRRFDIVGIAGNTRRLPGQPSWIIANLKLELDPPDFLSGSVGQGPSFPPARLHAFGPVPRQCKLLDGVFLAVASPTLAKSGLRFDSRFAFHFYDMDFCRTAESLGLSMGTIPLSVVHQSYGSLDERWRQAYDTYLGKWTE